MRMRWHNDPGCEGGGTHKASLQVPAPTVVEEAHDQRPEEVPNQQGHVRSHGVGYDEAHKLLATKQRRLIDLMLHHPSERGATFTS